MSVEKAETFAKHLSNAFVLHPPFMTTKKIYQFLNALLQMSKPITAFSLKEILQVIHKQVNPKKAPGFDHITGRILKELPIRGIALMTAIFNAILGTGYYPRQCKLAHTYYCHSETR